MLTTLLILAAFFGLSGTVIESAGYWIEHKKLSYVGDKYFWNIPLKPIYAIGGLLLYYSVKILSPYPWHISILISALVVTFWEYICGVFCVKVLGRRLWDYSKRRVNIHGHVSFWSAKWWLIFTLIFYFFLYKYVLNFQLYLDKVLKISKTQDLLVFTTVIIAGLILTFIRKSTFR